MSVTGENWRPVKGWEGLYEVSTFGNVRSLNREVVCKSRYGGNIIMRFSGKRMVKRLDHNGYECVHLRNGSRNKQVKVHRLVAEAFLDNCDNLPYINHKDENKTNNSVDNLEWCTPKYNTNYGTGKKRRSKAKSKKCVAMDEHMNVKLRFDSLKDAGEHFAPDWKNPKGNIWQAIKNGCKAWGYYWAYE